jgi:hypothetical protein
MAVSTEDMDVYVGNTRGIDQAIHDLAHGLITISEAVARVQAECEEGRRHFNSWMRRRRRAKVRNALRRPRKRPA